MRWLILAALAALAACGTAGVRDTSAPAYPTEATIRAAMEAVRPLHAPLGPPAPTDWLASYAEPGQTFDEYLGQEPVTAHGERRVLYVQPLGQFTESERRIVTLTADFLGRYYGLPVRTLDDMSLDLVPAEARRERPDLGVEQIATGHVTMNLLLPRLPADAAACIALTASDLWPGNEWNFVFGQASTRERVGVWSIHRLGDPGAGDEAFRTCLRRTLKIASHETGHMFTIMHCTKYECAMCGSLSLPETDRWPVEACPECMAKICWATGVDPAARFRRLAEFCRAHGLEAEAAFYVRSLEAADPAAPRPAPERAAAEAAAAAARAEIEALTAERAEAWRRRDASAFLAHASPDFSLRLANGLAVDRDGMRAMLESGWRRMPEGRRDTFALGDVHLDGDTASVVLRHEFDDGRTVYRETWVRDGSGWRLSRSQELHQ